MKFLVTGGAGFIGSALIRRLLSDGESTVLNVDKLTYAANPFALQEFTKNSRYKFYQTDICQSEKIQSILINEKPDYLLHFAAESHVDRSITGADPFIYTNVMGTYSLLKVCLAEYENKSLPDHFRFLHVSTDEVYGSLELDEQPFSESSQYRPNSPYSASKAASDHLVRSWIKTYNFPALTTHCSNNYGPYQNSEKMIPLMISNCIFEKPLPIYGDGKNIRDWIYVEDHVEALITILKSAKLGSVYNIGGETELSNLELVDRICKMMDQKKPRKNGQSYRELIQFVADRKGHDFRYAISNNKINFELDWMPKTSFDSGLASTVDWYLKYHEENKGKCT